MHAGLLFWVIWLIILIFGGVGVYRRNPPDNTSPGWALGGFWLAVWVELGLLGWKAFGPPLQ